jgi:GTPase SAR1 family protein
LACLKRAEEEVFKMLIGNKCDMQNNRIISTEKGEEVAQRYKVPFMETSAKDNINIDEAFNKMTQLLLNKVSFSFFLIPNNYLDHYFVARKIPKYLKTRI